MISTTATPRDRQRAGRMMLAVLDTAPATIDAVFREIDADSRPDAVVGLILALAENGAQIAATACGSADQARDTLLRGVLDLDDLDGQQ
jgi:hypothetical protein